MVVKIILLVEETENCHFLTESFSEQIIFAAILAKNKHDYLPEGFVSKNLIGALRT